MAFKLNPTTGLLDLVGMTSAQQAAYLLLDQTTPQVTVGTFTFPIGIFTIGINDNAGTPLLSIDPNTRMAYDVTGTALSLDWAGRQLYDSVPVLALDWGVRTLYDTAGTGAVLDWTGTYNGSARVSFGPGQINFLDQFGDSGGVLTIHPTSRLLCSTGGSTVLDWGNTALVDTSSQLSVDWTVRTLYATDGSTAMLRWENTIGLYGGSSPTGILDLVAGTLKSYITSTDIVALDFYNRTLNDIYGVTCVSWGDGTYALTTTTESYFSNTSGTYAYLAGSSYGAYFGDPFNYVYLGDGTYAVNAVGQSYFTDGSNNLYVMNGSYALTDNLYWYIGMDGSANFTGSSYGSATFGNVAGAAAYIADLSGNYIYIGDGNYIINANTAGGAILTFGSQLLSISYANLESNGSATFAYGGATQAIIGSNSYSLETAGSNYFASGVWAVTMFNSEAFYADVSGYGTIAIGHGDYGWYSQYNSTTTAFNTSPGFGGVYAGYFSDGSSNEVKIADGIYALNITGDSLLPKIITPSIRPSADSTTAIRVYKADGATAVLTIDTTNGRVGIGMAPATEQFTIQTSATVPTGLKVNGDTAPCTTAGNYQIASLRRTFSSNEALSMNPTGVLCAVTNSSIQTGTASASIQNIGQSFSVSVSGAHTVVPTKTPPSETNVGYWATVGRSGTLAWKTGGTITSKGLDLTVSHTHNINISGGTMTSTEYGMYAAVTCSPQAETAGTHTSNSYGAYYFVNGGTSSTGVTTGYGQWCKVNSFDNCYGYVTELSTTAGNGYAIWISNDDANGNGKIHFGAAKDATIGFTGTQLLIQSDVVTATDSFQLRGGTNGVLFNVGATQQLAITSLTGTFVDAFNLVFGTTTGTKIGTGTTQKIGFYNATPVVQQTGTAAQKTTYAAGELDTEAEVIAAINATNTAINVLRTALNALGLTSVV